MSQREYYNNKTVVKSEPTGLLSRDNRNHRKKRRLITDVIAAEPGDAILEVGCGHGIHAKRYAKEYEYTGVDISDALCAATRKRLAPITNDSNVTVADAMDLPFQDDAFEAVVGTAVLHHMRDQHGAFAEWARVASGSVTVMEPNYLFPKDMLETHTKHNERHKRNMTAGRMRQLPTKPTVSHHIFTLPWPRALWGVYDRIDSLAGQLPVLKHGSQMLRVHSDLAPP